CWLLAPAPVRFYARLPLPFPSAHDGIGVVSGLLEMESLSDRRREVQPGRTVLGKNLRCQLCRRCCYRHSDGISVRNQLGFLFALCRWRDWPDARDGGLVGFFFG